MKRKRNETHESYSCTDKIYLLAKYFTLGSSGVYVDYQRSRNVEEVVGE